VAEVAARFNIDIGKTKWLFDMTLLIISITLAVTLFGDAGTFDWSTIGYASFHSIGLGTLVTTAINSPIISLMGRLIDALFDQTPRFAKLEQILKRK
jgi:hypothetical protein